MKSGDKITVEIIIEGSLEVKLPTIWTDEKQRWEESEKRREEREEEEEEGEERSGKRKSQKTEDAGAGKGFQLCGAPEGGKGGSLRRRVRSHLGR